MESEVARFEESGRAYASLRVGFGQLTLTPSKSYGFTALTIPTGP